MTAEFEDPFVLTTLLEETTEKTGTEVTEIEIAETPAVTKDATIVDEPSESTQDSEKQTTISSETEVTGRPELVSPEQEIELETTPSTELEQEVEESELPMKDTPMKQESTTESILIDDKNKTSTQATVGVPTEEGEETEATTVSSPETTEITTETVFCSKNGVRYENGEAVPSTTPCEHSCVCSGSVVNCQIRACPPAPPAFLRCSPIQNGDQCCPSYDCGEQFIKL